jgi:hypothetical protein
VGSTWIPGVRQDTLITLRLLLLLLLPPAVGAQTQGGQAPSVATGTPSGFSSTSVTIYGVVDPNGLPTYFYWEWGTSTSYGTILYPGSVGGQTTAVSLTSGISGLSPDTTYHYRLAATNSAGVSFGGDQSFTTPTLADQVFSYTIANNIIDITGYGGPLGSVLIPDTIARLPVGIIGGSAFSGLTGLINVTLPAGLTTIGSDAFAACSGLTNLTIPPGVTQIQDSAFFACTGLTNVTVPESVSTLGDSVFANCTGLRTATINSSSTGDYEFNGCSNLATVAIGNRVTVISGEAFENCGLTSVTIPDSVLNIMNGYNGWWIEGAFSACTGLTNALIGQSVTNIGDNALAGCTNLAAITLGSSVQRIGLHAFRGCTRLSGVMIPQSVTNIACDTMWAPYAGTPFSDCTSLTAILVDPLNPAYSSLDGVLFDNRQTLLIACPGGKTGKYAVPEGVRNIQPNALSGCGSLTSISIPGSVTNLDWNSFYGCTNLAALYFRGNAPSVDPSAFGGGDNLTVYYLPGTTGWSTNFGGAPTALWNPQPLTRDAGFGVQHNRFGFNITGTAGLPLVIEACTDLTAGAWVPLQSCTLTNSLIYFSDSQWTNSPRRFYRIRSP